MNTERSPYPSDVRDEEWHFVLLYLTLMRLDAPQSDHDLREVFDALRWKARAGAGWPIARRLPAPARRLPADAALARSGRLRDDPPTTCARRCASPLVADLAAAVQGATGDHVTLAYVDQGDTGDGRCRPQRSWGPSGRYRLGEPVPAAGAGL